MNLTHLKIFKNTEFKYLILGRFFMIMAFRMAGTLVGWWVYLLTKDPFSIGLIGLSEVIPAVSSALYAGHVIDQSEKKKLLLICNFLYIILLGLLLLPFVFKNQFYFNKENTTYFIYFIIFCTGFVRAFLGPLIPSILPSVVSKADLPMAVTLNSACFLTASVIGHSLGGALIATIGLQNCLFAIVFSLVISFIIFNRLYAKPPTPKILEQNMMESIKEGILYIWKTKEILGALTLDLFAVLFGGAVAMIPVFAADVLKVGPGGFGWLNAAADIGSMLMIISLSIVPLKKNQGKILLYAVAGFGVCILFFALSEYYWLSFILLVFSGLLDGISVVIRSTIVQLKTPDAIRGRVLSVNSIFINSSNELGQFESGLAAKILGLVRSVVVGGSLTILVAIGVGLFSPKLRKMNY